MSNKTLMQYFEWYLPVDVRHWKRTAEDAAHLAWLGISDVWLPPAYKGQAGIKDVGYGVYDLYDLGEFYQKDTITTKYGTMEEYLAAIRALQDQGIHVLGDIVLNHRMGADYLEDVKGTKMDPKNRNLPIVTNKKLTVSTGFTFPGRNGKYSSFCWNQNHFSGIDFNERTQMGAIFKFNGREWSNEVDPENGNYDYLMGANVDFQNEEVVNELVSWGKWYLKTTGIDGVRLDAIKHIHRPFFPMWLAAMRKHFDQEIFAVGEYWNGDPNTLENYLNDTGRCMSLFDVTLHYRFQQAADQGSAFNLCTIFDDTLVSRAPEHAVTFVDNHDTQPHQALASWVQDWFKPLAYSLILLRDQGTPCVFYGDMYGIPRHGIQRVPALEKLLLIRRLFALGGQHDYFDFPNVIGWTRDGGMAAVMSNGDDGHKKMKLGCPGQVFVDVLRNCPGKVVIDENGEGEFRVRSRSVSIWIPRAQAVLYNKYFYPEEEEYPGEGE